MENITNDVMNVAEQKVDKVKNVENGYMYVNRLKYVIPSNISVVEKRMLSRSYPDINNYNSSLGTEMIIKINSSTNFIDPRNSYLTFQINAFLENGSTQATTYNKLTEIGVLSIFSRILIESKDGSELERIDNAHVYIPAKYILESSLDSQNVLKGPLLSNQTLSAPLTACIPLSLLSGLWSSNTLMPPNLSSGMRLRFTLNNNNIGDYFETVTVVPATSAKNFGLSNISIMCDTLQLVPLITRTIMEQSAQGLDYTYKTVFSQYNAFAKTESAFNVEINKSVSRCNDVIFLFKKNNYPNGVNSLTALNNNINYFQARLGDLYFPVNPIQSNGGGLAEFYTYLYLYSNNNLYKNQCDNAGYLAYNSTPKITTDPVDQLPSVSGFNVGANTANALASPNSTKGYYKVSLERSGVLELTGLPINNSRALVLNIQKLADDPAVDSYTTNILYTFAGYVKLAKCFPRNITVKE